MLPVLSGAGSYVHYLNNQNTYIAIVLPPSTSKEMNAEETRLRDNTIKELTKQFLEMERKTYGNTAQCRVKSQKMFTIANAIPKLNTKLEEAQHTFHSLCDGRMYGDEMKQLALNVVNNHLSGSVESAHTAAAVFTALSASTDESIALMRSALCSSPSTDEKREYAKSRGLTDIDELVEEKTNDYCNYHLSCVESSCKILKLKMRIKESTDKINRFQEDLRRCREDKAKKTNPLTMLMEGKSPSPARMQSGLNPPATQTDPTASIKGAFGRMLTHNPACTRPH